MFHCLKSLLGNTKKRKENIQWGRKPLHNLLPGFGSCSHFGEFLWIVRNMACSAVQPEKKTESQTNMAYVLLSLQASMEEDPEIIGNMCWWKEEPHSLGSGKFSPWQ